MSTAPTLLPVGELARMLGAQASSLARELLPGGRREGHEWRVGSLAGEPGRSLAVHLDGPKAGIWADFSADQRGDALDLVAAVLFAGDKRRAIDWARRWLGLDGGDPARIEQARRRVARAREDHADEAVAAEKRRRQAQALWLAGKPVLDTPAEAYLAARGIRLRAFAHVPNAIRFHPACWCAEVKGELPAMVTAIGDRDGRHAATHRTYLAEIDGVWRKANLQTPKKVLGSLGGGYVRLTRGAAGTPWRDLAGTEVVAFTEGIENALAVASLVPEWRTAAAGSLAQLGRVVLPGALREAVICCDNDAGNEAAQAALRAAVVHFQRQGVLVRLARPRDGVKDWNDELLADDE